RWVCQSGNARSDAALEHLVDTDIMALSQRLQRLVEADRQPNGVLDGLHDTHLSRVRSALSENVGNAWVFKSHSAAHSKRTLEKRRKSWMHRCVRCVSKLLVRYEVSRPFCWLHDTRLPDIGFGVHPAAVANPVE